MPPAYCDLIFRVSHSKEKCRDGIKPFLHFWSEWRDSFASAPIGADRGSPPSSWRRQRSSALHLIVRVSHSKDKSRESKCSFGFYGPSGETRTRGILVPNQAPYQLGHTRIAPLGDAEGNNTKILYRIFMGNASKICCISRAAGNCAKHSHMGDNPRPPEGRRTSVRLFRPRTAGDWTFPEIPAFHKYSCGNPDIRGNSRRPSRRSAAPAVH